MKARHRLIQTIQHQKPRIQMEVRAVVAVAVAAVVVAVVRWMARQIKMAAILRQIQAKIWLVNQMINQILPIPREAMAKARIIPTNRTIPTRRSVMVRADAVAGAVAVVKVVVAIKDQTVNQLFIPTRRNAPRRNKV